MGSGDPARRVHLDVARYPLSSTVVQAREVLGHRLRDLRKDAGLTGRALAALVGWDSSKISKIEYGKQTPTEDDIRAWCRHCQATDRIPDLIATVRNIDAMYTEWRRVLRAGTHGRQQASLSLEAQTGLFRWYEPVLVADQPVHHVRRAPGPRRDHLRGTGDHTTAGNSPLRQDIPPVIQASGLRPGGQRNDQH